MIISGKSLRYLAKNRKINKSGFCRKTTPVQSGSHESVIITPARFVNISKLFLEAAFTDNKKRC